MRSELVFQQAIKDYADGRKVCNCGEAYRGKDGYCDYGCSANQIFAKYDLVQRILAGRGRDENLYSSRCDLVG